MSNSKTVHIGMINSYNVLVKNFDIQRIVLSGIGFFAHSESEKDAKISVEFMVKYFQDIEMYEKCSALQKYIKKTFDEEGKFKEQLCDCEYPDIEKYNPIPKCSLCNMRIRRL